VADDQLNLLSTMPASRWQRRAAFLVAVFLFGLFIVAEMFGDIRWPVAPGVAALVAGIEASSFLLTATLLYASFSIRLLPRLLVLAAGFTFTGLMLVSWAVSFPGAFGAKGLLGDSAQTSFYLALVAFVGPAFTAITYVAASMGEEKRLNVQSAARTNLTVIGCICIVVVAITWAISSAGDSLPPMMLDSLRVSPLWARVAPTLVLIYIVAAVAVAFRSDSVLDTWFAVTLWSWVLESLLATRFGYRFSLRWYIGIFFEFFSATAVLAALLSQITSLYARLGISLLAERRERESRLLTVDAALASLAHQIFQPISAILTNAGTGLREVARPEIRRGVLEEILTDIATDSRRVGNALEAIRAVFRTGGREKENVQIFELLRESVELAHGELQARRITVDALSDAALPPVLGNRLQLQQVVLNLIQNAADAMESVNRGPRLLRIGAVRDGDSVLVTVQDSGPGLATGAADRAFDPFFSTKSNGTGLGLAICRMIVEAHGGNIMLMAGIPAGTVAQFTLPIAHAA
jgi:signal transduction histidine kinase